MCEVFRVIFGPISLLYKFVFQIVWVIEERKYAGTGGYQAFLVVVLDRKM
jgi:hypothetical protein